MKLIKAVWYDAIDKESYNFIEILKSGFCKFSSFTKILLVFVLNYSSNSYYSIFYLSFAN